MMDKCNFLQEYIYLVFVKKMTLVNDEVSAWWSGKAQRERWKVGKDHMHL
jgi:hypothetical protein